jgi:hypothetical protein
MRRREIVKNLFIEATEYTPRILFDGKNNVIEIKGTSYPENASSFYAPMFSWLEKYFSQQEDVDVTVNIEIVYFNSSSSRALEKFFDLLGEVVFRSIYITVNWIYEDTDEDMLEYGKEFQEDYKGLEFNFVQKEVKYQSS